jgi:hypothetical protein
VNEEPRADVTRQRRTFAIGLGVAWFVALVVVVVVTVATRSKAANAEGYSGWVVLVFTAPGILLATWRLREPTVAVITVSIAAIVTCALGADILRDDSLVDDVRPLGLLVFSLLVVGAGILVQVLMATTQRPGTSTER